MTKNPLPEDLKAKCEEAAASRVHTYFKGEKKKVLAFYHVPLGDNHAMITVKGDRLTSEDFDALAEFIAFARKQFKRNSKP